MKLSEKLTVDEIVEACEKTMFGLENIGFCLACGDEVYGVEPDAECYRCEACGEHKVMGAENILIMCC